jgi:hypothetical protein
MQGYLFSKPRPAEEIRELFATHRGAIVTESPARKRRPKTA